MSQIKLSDEVKDILTRSSIEGTLLKLPEQLDRKSYEAVNKIITAAGGKWNRHKGGHIFSEEAIAKLNAALAEGTVRNDKKHFQEFFTPPSLAARVVELAQVGGCRVLEPSAGRGALAKECLEHGASRVCCFELQPRHAEALRLDGRYAYAKQCDFLEQHPIMAQEQFQRIVMNPPFTKGAALTHLKHAMNWVAPGGRIVCILPDIRTQTAFLKFACPGHHEMKDFTLEDVPEGTFKESGTCVRTMIMVINMK